MDAEKACTKALTQHKSSKGYYRRARARKMLGQRDDALNGKSYLLPAHILLTLHDIRLASYFTDSAR